MAGTALIIYTLGIGEQFTSGIEKSGMVLRRKRQMTMCGSLARFAGALFFENRFHFLVKQVKRLIFLKQ
jgi:hypothetical protein